jgi:hypothetical protein
VLELWTNRSEPDTLKKEWGGKEDIFAPLVVAMVIVLAGRACAGESAGAEDLLRLKPRLRELEDRQMKKR